MAITSNQVQRSPVQQDLPGVPGGSTDAFEPSNDIENFYKTTEGRYNVLHNYNTYSYNITLASLSKDQLENPDSYKGRVFTGGTETSDFFIIARSGGFKRNNAISVGPNQNLTTDFDEGFQAKQEDLRDKDFYIENVRFETRVGINNLGSANLTRGSFEILEPYSSTGFYTTLYNSSVFAGHPNYLGAPFLLVISFLGRKADDLDGEPEVVDKATRYLPIRITKSDMTVTEEGSRYTVEFIGFNQTMNSAVHSTTKEDINGPTQASTQMFDNQDVGVVLFDFFKKHQQKYEEHYRTMWENALRSNTNITQQLAERATQAGQRAASGGTTVNRAGPNNTHKYSLWFAGDYGGYTTGPSVFPDNLKDIKHETFTGVRDTVLASGSESASPQYSNPIMKSKMLKGDLPRTGGRNIPSVDAENDRLQDLIDKEAERLQEASNTLDTVKSALTGQIKTDVEALKQILPPEERNKLDTDLNAGPTERTDDAALSTLESLQSDLQSIQSSIGVPSGPPVGPNAPGSAIPLVDELLTKINNNIDRIRNAISEKALATEKIRLIREQQAENQSRGQAFHSGDIPWSWKQGINLNTVINTVILESTFAGKLQESSTLTSIQRTGMVDWFRIDTYQNVIGFDPFTMDFIYDFHFVVSPYKIHYSKLPGLNIVFKTDYLKQRAVREYNYLYTGKNLDVLDFGLNYNNLFFSPYVMRNPQDTPTANQEEDEAITEQHLASGNYPDSIKAVQTMLTGYSMIQPVLRNNRPVHGRGTPVYANEVAQAFQDFLFRPIADQALLRAQIKIVGDPVYILGSGVADRPTLTFDSIETTQGEMNAFTKEVDIIFKFQNINDLPSASELESQGQPTVNINKYNGVYQLLSVNNFFEEGQFYQELSTLRRPNQPTDFETEPAETNYQLEESQIDGTGSQAQDNGGETQDGQTSEQPVEDNDRVRPATDLIPTVPPNSPVGRLISSISAETGLSEADVVTQIGNKVQDNRIQTGIDLSQRGAEATTEEIVSAATSLYPDLFPSGRSVGDIVSLFNTPLPTQDQIRQNISTPGDPRPNILDVINAGQDIYNRYSSLLPGGGVGTGNGSIRLSNNARKYWGNVPPQEKTRLFNLANSVDFPLGINNGQRPTTYNEEVGGAEGSRHLTGQAFDIDVSGLDYNQRVALIRNASANGFNGIQYYGNTLHIDSRPPAQRWGSNVSGDSRFDDFLDQHQEAPLTATSGNPEN